MANTLEDHLRKAPTFPFYSTRITKSHAASYLRQYRQHQWVTASRGLLSTSIPQATDPPSRDEYEDGRLDEENEMVLARLYKTQISLDSKFSQIYSDVLRLEQSLLSTRKDVWIRTGLVAIFASVCLAFITRGVSHGKGSIWHTLQSWIPVLPSPIALFYIAARERQISAVEAAKSRLEGLRVAVAEGFPVSLDDISWLGTEKWDGVDFSRVGL